MTEAEQGIGEQDIKLRRRCGVRVPDQQSVEDRHGLVMIVLGTQSFLLLSPIAASIWSTWPGLVQEGGEILLA